MISYNVYFEITTSTCVGKNGGRARDIHRRILIVTADLRIVSSRSNICGAEVKLSFSLNSASGTSPGIFGSPREHNNNNKPLRYPVRSVLSQSQSQFELC